MKSPASIYQVQRPSRSSTLALRDCHYHLRHWGSPERPQPLLVLLHGWMDVSASWQFMVDALPQAFAEGRHIVAPDWRGFGQSQGPRTDCYWIPDYLGDLDALLDVLSPDAPVDLVGHSMGGNVVMMYAGARPERVRRVINLEGFGMPATDPKQAPARLGQWLGDLKRLSQGELDLSSYASAEDVAARLCKTNPRLDASKAAWLAPHWAAQQGDGRWCILGDAAHKVVNPYLFRVEEMLAIYRAITAPVLAVEASDDSLATWFKGRYTLQEFHQRIAVIAQAQIERIADTGHMLHHDRPQAVAEAVVQFLTATQN